jgi:hypothetical protein
MEPSVETVVRNIVLSREIYNHGVDYRACISSRACSILFSAPEYVSDILQAMVVGGSMMLGGCRIFLR